MIVDLRDGLPVGILTPLDHGIVSDGKVVYEGSYYNLEDGETYYHFTRGDPEKYRQWTCHDGASFVQQGMKIIPLRFYKLIQERKEGKPFYEFLKW